MKTVKGKYLMVIMALCGVIGASVGIVTNVAGIFFQPVAEELGVGKGQVSLTLTICNFCFAAGGMFCPRLLNDKSFKPTVAVCMMLLSFFTFLLSKCGSIVIMYFCNIFRGISAGIIGMVFVTMTINQWFHQKSALMTSLVLGFSGVAGSFFSPIISNIIDTYGWRAGYQAEALFSVFLILPALLMPIGWNPAGCGMVPYGWKEELSDVKTDDVNKELSLSVLLIVFICAAIAAFITSFPPHFPGLADNAEFGSMMLSFCMISNTVGKMALGVLIEKTGVRKGLMIYGGLVIIGIIFISLSDNHLLLLIGAVLIGLSYALGAVGNSLMIKEKFGEKLYGKVYPKISFGGMAANAIGASVIGFFYDYFNSYRQISFIMIGLLVFYVLMIACIFKKQETEA